MTRRTRLAIGIGVLVVVLAGTVVIVRLSLGSIGPKTQAVEETAKNVMNDAEDWAEAIDVPFELESLSAIACTGELGEVNDTVYSIRGGFLYWPDDKKVDVRVEKMHDIWKERNWKIVDFRRVSDGIVLAAKDPDSGYEYHMNSYSDDGYINAPIYSPCYDDPTWQGKKNDLYEMLDIPEPSPKDSESS